MDSHFGLEYMCAFLRLVDMFTIRLSLSGMERIM